MTTKKDDALQTVDSAAMERPDWIPAEREGLEHVTRDDIKLPRLMIAQGLSPEVQEGDGAQIPDLRPGMLFNDLNKEVYGKETIAFWVVRADPPHYVEFVPREEGGGVKDPNVPANDPRALDGTATKFYDFIVFMKRGEKYEPIAISLKGKAGNRAARVLNGLMNMRNAPCYAGNYTVTPGMVKNAKGTFAVYNFMNAGWPKTKEEMEARKKLFVEYKDKQIEIEHDDEVPADSLDHESAPVPDGDIPF